MQKLDKQIIELYKGNDTNTLPIVSLLPNLCSRVLVTNGYEVLHIPVEHYPDDLEPIPILGIAQYNQLTALGIFSKNFGKLFSTDTLQKNLSLTQESRSTCDACNGKKTVEYHFEYAFKEFCNNAPCPVCKGTGYQTVPWHNVLVGMNLFQISRIEKLLKVAQALAEPTIELSFQATDIAVSNFKIGAITVSIVRSFFDENNPPLFELCTSTNTEPQ